MNRRLFILSSATVVGGASMFRSFSSELANVFSANPEMVALIDRTRCDNGMHVAEPDGKDGGFLYPNPKLRSENPPWNLCQWSSRFTLAGKPLCISDDGCIASFSDESKSIHFRMDDGMLLNETEKKCKSAKKCNENPFDIRMELDGRIEYDHRIPRAGQAWPHLLLERHFLEKPRITKLRSVHWRIDFRIPASERETGLDGWNDGLHTAQFLAYLTLQNLNPEDAGYGDYLWFGVPMFDIRHRHAPRYAAEDFSTAEKEGTGRMIFLPGADEYFNDDPHTGQWITINRDILPLLHESLEAAWNRGFLKDSRNPDDYRLSMMNIGWEITAPIHAVAEIRNFMISAEKNEI